MPRPREIEEGDLISLKIPRAWIRALDHIAASRGIKSRSKLLRMIIHDYLSRVEHSQLQTPETPPHLDPLEELEQEELRQAVVKFKMEVEKALEIASRYGKYGSRIVLLSGGSRTEITLPSAWDLMQRWNKLKRWYKTLPRDPQVSQLLVDINKRIKEYGKLRGEMT